VSGRPNPSDYLLRGPAPRVGARGSSGTARAYPPCPHPTPGADPCQGKKAPRRSSSFSRTRPSTPAALASTQARREASALVLPGASIRPRGHTTPLPPPGDGRPTVCPTD
jgi:hypothetical protein